MIDFAPAIRRALCREATFDLLGLHILNSSPQRLETAKAILKAKGWSYRKAAPLLDVHWVHLSSVLNGHRVSRRLLNKIEVLPDRPAKGAA